MSMFDGVDIRVKAEEIEGSRIVGVPLVAFVDQGMDVELSSEVAFKATGDTICSKFSKGKHPEIEIGSSFKVAVGEEDMVARNSELL